MKRIRNMLKALTAVTLVTSSAVLSASDKQDDSSVDALIKGNTDFALKMHQTLSSQSGNIFFSPYSISSAIAMTCAGARGDTEKEIKNVLSFPYGQGELCSSFGELQEGLNAIQNAGDIKLSIANAIWYEKKYAFLSSFIDFVQNDYRAEITGADFVNNAEAERKIINSWVEQKTNDKIKNLIPNGVLNALTRMVLVNAIYFKGDWASPFKETHTRELDFNVSPTNNVKTKMMYQQDDFRLAEDEDTQALEMMYNGERISMLVLLPKQNNDINKLENSLTADKLNSLIANLRKTKVQVTFPKFKIETGYDLVQPFIELGMKDAFNKSADFSGMDGTSNLYVSAIVHKAFVEVDEKGTEAAAATAVVMALKSIPRFERFNANHPFLFFIRDNITGSILFMGRIVDPNIN